MVMRTLPKLYRATGSEYLSDVFWAYPEEYQHVAMVAIRRADVVWTGDEVADYHRLAERAGEVGVSVAELLKQLGRDAVER